MAVRRGVSPLARTESERGIDMPADIAANPVLSEIWGWVCPPVNTFSSQDVPTLRELVTWHATFEQCRAVLVSPEGRVDIFNKQAVTTMKQASAEIRALSDMLGLSPLARSRIGLMDATTVKTAADTAAMFAAIDSAYGEIVDVSDAD